MIPFGDFAPNLADTTPGRSSVIDGVIPRADGSYGPMPQLVTQSGASVLPSAPKGHISFPKSDGSYARYIATSSNWYDVGADGTLNSIGSGYAVPPGDQESFVRFGTKLIGSNIFDGMRAYDVETGGAVAGVAGAPKARCIFELGGFIVALDCDGDNRLIRNSDFNDHTSWTTGDGVADSQPVEDGGALIAGVAIAQGMALIFQREAIRLMTVQASGALYSLSLIEKNAGAVAAKSVVGVSGGACFLDTDGFKFASPGGVRSIGETNGVSAWFVQQVGAARLTEVEGAYDRFRRIVWWRFPVSNDSDSVFSRMIGYHVDLQKWVTLTVATSAIFTTALPGYTWDTIPDLSWDTIMDVPWDDRSLAGGEPTFGAMDGDLKFSSFSGLPMAVTLETAKADLGSSRLFNRIALIGDGADATLQLGVADRLQDEITWKDAASLTASGTFPVRGRGRVVQYRLKRAAGDSWTSTGGLDFPNGFGR